MALPKDLHWASDATYPAGTDPWSGAPTKVEPTTGKKDRGMTPETPQSAMEMNWWMGAVGDILGILDARDGTPVLFDSVGTHTWHSGPTDTRVEIELWGAGGGGGGGGYALSTKVYSCSGAGGAGSLKKRVILDVTPDTDYHIIIQAGGTGGLGGLHVGLVEATAGTAGGSTSFCDASDSPIVTAHGGTGGQPAGQPTNGPLHASALTTCFAVFPGGVPTDRFRFKTPIGDPADFFLPGQFDLTYCDGPGVGGDGISRVVALFYENQMPGGDIPRNGAQALEGYLGGQQGPFGTDATFRFGGPGGGGGGAGPFGPGFDGNFGGNANDSGNGTSGHGGGGGSDGQGCGGGGGGGGGVGSTGGTDGGGGTGGSSGALILRVIS